MLHTPFCDLLGVEHPIISAPMAGAAGADLAAAVSQAGGLGLVGGTMPGGGGADWLRAQIWAVRERTHCPFGVGFVSSAPNVEALVQVALEERGGAIAHSFVDPTPYVGAAHAAGVKVLVQVQTVAQAITAARAGADVIAAQGTEAGGHTGYSGTLALVPAVVDVAGALPVIAAGGIADGCGLAAVLMLGAPATHQPTPLFPAAPQPSPDKQQQRRRCFHYAFFSFVTSCTKPGTPATFSQCAPNSRS